MSSVDDRVVNMRFNNSTFEKGARTSLSTLDRLKKALNFSAQEKSIGGLQSAANKFHLGTMGVNVEGVSKKLLALGTIGVTAISNITNRAINAGIQMGKSLTIAPLAAGFQNYETQINAVQTILANTGLKGASGLGKVNTVLAQLNTYANQTIYNFSEMARNIGTFTAAGVNLKTSANAIKGIANLAALSGSNSEQASTAMYQLSQAIAAGRVKLQDWNSVVNAGMGGKVFQTALWNTAKTMGTIKDVPMGETFAQWTKKGNTFRDSLQSGWLTGKVLTSTLSQFTGDLTDAQLKSMGYNTAQIKQIQDLAKTANNAATKIKTMTQLTQALKEEVATAWSAVFKTIFGNINMATTLFSKVHTVTENALTKPVYDLNKLLEGWAKLGGRTKLISALKNAFKDLAAVLDPIKKAWRDIVPATTAKNLYSLTVRLDNFFKRVKIGDKTADDLRRTFRGIFAVFDIIKQVVGGVIHVFTDLFSSFHGGNDSFLQFTGNIGDMIVSFDNALKRGQSLSKFFDGLSVALTVPLHMLSLMRQFIFNLFDGFAHGDVNVVSTALQTLGSSLASLPQLSTKVQNAWNKVVSVFNKVQEKLKPLTDGIKQVFHSISQTISDALGSASFDDIVKLFNTVLLGGITLALKKFLSKGVTLDVGGGFLGSIKESFESLTGVMKSMQTQLKAKTLLEIAGAITLLAISLIALSGINPRKLTAATKSMALLFTQLLIAMSVVTRISKDAGFLKIPIIAASMILLSGAVLLLTIALKRLAKLDMQAMNKGLKGVGLLLAEVSGSVMLISRAQGSMARTALGLIGLAVAINILVIAVKSFARMSWKDIEKGLVGVAGALLVIAGAVRLLPKGMSFTGAGLLIVSSALLVLSKAVRSFAGFNVKDIAKGLGGIGASLAIIAGAMRLMPPGMILQAAGLVLVGIALQSIAKAVASMGRMNWHTMAKGLIGLAGALAILAGAMAIMEGAFLGSVALGIAAVSLNLLAGVLKTLGKLSWTEIVKGLVAMAGAFLVIGGTAAILTPLTPVIAALALAMLAFGAALTLFGVGIFLFGKGMAALVKGGTEGVKVLLQALDGFIERIPAMATALARGLVDFVLTIGKNAPAMVGALGKIIIALLDAITAALPHALRLFTRLIHTLIQAVNQNAPDIVHAGFNLLVKFLQGATNAMPRVIRSAADLIIAFIQGIGDNIGRVIDAGLRFVVRFLDGVADGIRNNEPKILKAGAHIGMAIVQGLWQGISDFAGWLWNKISFFFSDIWHNTLVFFGIDSPSTLFMYVGQMIIEGIWEGVKKLAHWLWDKIKSFLGDIWHGVMHVFDVHSPSRKFAWLGEMLMRGLGMGIDDNASVVHKSITNMSKGAIDALNKGLSNAPDILNGMDSNPTIRPVLDLTDVHKNAAKIGGILGGNSVGTNVSLTNARAVAGNVKASAATQAIPVPVLTKEVKFEQNNYSPKSLGPVEIYRQTKNQLALAREELTS